MIMSYGSEEYIDNKKKLIRYNFFKDEHDGGRDAIFGLDIPLMRLVNVLKARPQGYGPEKRVILLHGPVGSSKSTIARLLKKGSRTTRARPRARSTPSTGCCPSELQHVTGGHELFECPMHEEPLRLIPPSGASSALDELGLNDDEQPHACRSTAISIRPAASSSAS